jgi:peroxiredoxin
MAATPSTMLDLGVDAPSFRLPDFNGHYHSLDDYVDKPLLVMFICNHCPFVIHVRSKFSELTREFGAKGLSVVAINSNDYKQYPDDAPENMEKIAEEFKFSFPYLVDEDQEVAKAYRAACTPEFYLFDAKHKLVYRGQMDDSRPGNDVPVTGADLSDAVNALLNGQEISSDQRPSMGCNIKWKKGNEPDYF